MKKIVSNWGMPRWVMGQPQRGILSALRLRRVRTDVHAGAIFECSDEFDTGFFDTGLDLY